MEYSDNKEISKKLLVNFDLRYIHKKLFLSCLNYKFQPEENNIKEKIIKYLIDNFKQIQFVKEFSVESAVLFQKVTLNQKKKIYFIL